MKKRLWIILILVFLLNISACEIKTAITDPVPQEIKATVPIAERKFIYNNDIKIEPKDINTKDENNVKVTQYYQVISGLKDKKVQDKINRDLEQIPKKLLTELEKEISIAKMNDFKNLDQKYLVSYIPYNYNNVIFVEYSASINTAFSANGTNSISKTVFYGYDLNTGKIINLADIFKPGYDYNTKINNFICQYIIENNYDDFESERMSKPFQGIRENQSFSFGIDGLWIILDEKNEEFVNYGYSDRIFIPLSYLGDDLYLFDKYCEENKSIYINEKRIKKLMRNKLEFRVNKIIEEGNDKYYINIVEGEFINVPDKSLEKRLNEMVVPSFDIEGFKKNAVTSTNTDGVPHYGHYINLFTNAGGYLSMSVTDEVYNNNYDLNRKIINYDFNLNKEILLKDLFIEGTDVSSIIETYIRSLNYHITEDKLKKAVQEAIKTNNFYFDESGVTIYFSPEEAKLDSYQKWVWIPFEAFGLEKITLFK